MIDPQIRVLLDAHLKQIEGLAHILGRVVTQQAELVRRLVALEAIAFNGCADCAAGVLHNTHPAREISL